MDHAYKGVIQVAVVQNTDTSKFLLLSYLI